MFTDNDKNETIVYGEIAACKTIRIHIKAIGKT